MSLRRLFYVQMERYKVRLWHARQPYTPRSTHFPGNRTEERRFTFVYRKKTRHGTHIRGALLHDFMVLREDQDSARKRFNRSKPSLILSMDVA